MPGSRAMFVLGFFSVVSIRGLWLIDLLDCVVSELLMGQGLLSILLLEVFRVQSARYGKGGSHHMVVGMTQRREEGEIGDSGKFLLISAEAA